MKIIYLEGREPFGMYFKFLLGEILLFLFLIPSKYQANVR